MASAPGRRGNPADATPYFGRSPNVQEDGTILTGTFGGAIQAASASATYVFTYTISAANTWETKTITIAGPTSGTWNSTNGAGLYLTFDIGGGTTYETTANTWTTGNYYRTSSCVRVAGTTGATWYITGVQLEQGTAASPFENRLYGTELALCQRYYFKITGSDSYSPIGTGTAYSTTTSGRIQIPFPVPMRNVPTPSFGGNITVVGNAVGSGFTLGTTYGGKLSLMQDISWTGAMSAAGVGLFVYVNSTSSDYFQCTAEL